jgi:Holliday junction resolvase RusA-like endonuclease
MNLQMKAGKNKKPRLPNYLAPDASKLFVATDGEFRATVTGRPMAFKRPGFGPWNGKRYNCNKQDQGDFVAALDELYTVHALRKSTFGAGEELEATIIFYMPPPKKAGKITGRTDLDNLAKFVLDAVQKGAIVTDDAQVTRLILEKKFGTEQKGATSITIRKRAIEIE